MARRRRQRTTQSAKESQRLMLLIGVTILVLIVLVFAWRSYFGLSRAQIMHEPTLATVKGGAVLPQGIMLNEQSLGGLTLDEALLKIDKEYAAIQGQKIRFTHLKKTVELTGKELGIGLDKVALKRLLTAKLGTQPSGTLRLPLVLEEKIFDQALETLAKGLETEAENAKSEGYDPEKRAFTVSAEKSGYKLDREAFKQEFRARLKDGEVPKTLAVELKEVEPEIKKEDVKTEMVLLGSASTNIPYYDAGRIQNLVVSAKRIDGTILQPGEVYSFLQAMGEFSEANGWAMAGMQADGVDTKGLGGGICQTSTTLFQAAILGGLDVVEQHNHDLPSNYCNLGEDAMVALGWADLKLVNNLAGPVLLVGYYSDPAVVFEVYGPAREEGLTTTLHVTYDGTIEPGESETRVNSELGPEETKIYRPRIEGQKTTLYRYWWKNGEVIQSDLICKNVYPAFHEIIEVGATTTTTETTEETTDPWRRQKDDDDDWHGRYTPPTRRPTQYTEITEPC